MTERSVLFGSTRSIYGVVTDPQGARQDRPAVLLLNAGLMHHIGPFRLYVLMARALAALGFTVLRFDLSSKGDSTARPGKLSYAESVKTDVAEALDYLEQTRGIKRFVLLGLCSGADDAYRCGLTDERIDGVALLDGYAYRTAGFYLRYYLPRLASPAKWLSFLKRSVGRKSGQSQPDADLEGDIFGMAFPPKKEFAAGLRKLLERNTSLLIVYSAGWFEYYNYAGQFGDAFPDIAKHSKVRVEYFDRADHTYTIVADRKRLIDLVTGWADASF